MKPGRYEAVDDLAVFSDLTVRRTGQDQTLIGQIFFGQIMLPCQWMGAWEHCDQRYAGNLLQKASLIDRRLKDR